MKRKYKLIIISLIGVICVIALSFTLFNRLFRPPTARLKYTIIHSYFNDPSFHPEWLLGYEDGRIMLDNLRRTEHRGRWKNIKKFKTFRIKVKYGKPFLTSKKTKIYPVKVLLHLGQFPDQSEVFNKTNLNMKISVYKKDNQRFGEILVGYYKNEFGDWNFGGDLAQLRKM